MTPPRVWYGEMRVMRSCAASKRSSTCNASPPISHSVWLALSTITCRLARSSAWAINSGQGVSTL